MALHAGSSLTTPRSDLGLAFEELDAEGVRSGFVGFQIAPVAEVSKQFDQYRRLKKEAYLQPRRTERNEDGSYRDVSAEYEIDTYATQDHGLEFPIDDRHEAAYADLIDEEMTGAEILRHSLLEAHELRVISAVNSLAVDDSAGALWSLAATDVVSQMTTYIQAFRLKCGMKPNALCIDTEVVDMLFDNDSVQSLFVGAGDRTKGRGIMLTGLAAALKVDEVIEANAVKNTKSEPLDATLAATWPREKMLLFRKSDSRNLGARSFMRTIHWGADGSRIGGTFEEYEDPKRRGRVLRARMDTQEKVVYSDCAYVVDTLVS